MLLVPIITQSYINPILTEKELFNQVFKKITCVVKKYFYQPLSCMRSFASKVEISIPFIALPNPLDNCAIRA